MEETGISNKPKPSKEWMELQTQFVSLCEEQEALYRPDFEKVFKAIYEIDNSQESVYNTNGWNIGCTLPDEANQDTIQKALEKTGFANDEAFCKDFSKYANIVIVGKKNMQERAALNIKEEMERCQPITKTNEWQFIPIRIFASKEIMSNVINPIMEKNAKEGKGLYGNITDIPEEDESLDEWFDIEAYGIKCSLESLYRDLQNYGVVDSVLKNDPIKEYYLKTIKSLIYFIRDNTDKPNRIRNHISSTLKELDDISTLGLLLQILLLQGLIKWFEDVDLKESDNGYKEACNLIQWIGEQLMKKEIRFCYYRWGEGDKEYLKPLCNYLLSTEIGEFVQDLLFKKQIDCSYIIDGEHETRKIPKEAGNNEKTTDKISLPSELDTEKARKYFAKAINVGYMKKEDSNYKWMYGGEKGQARLGYFCNKIYSSPRPINKLEEFFGVKKLSASITNADNEAKRADVKKWRNEMNNNIFND